MAQSMGGNPRANGQEMQAYQQEMMRRAQAAADPMSQSMGNPLEMANRQEMQATRCRRVWLRKIHVCKIHVWILVCRTHVWILVCRIPVWIHVCKIHASPNKGMVRLRVRCKIRACRVPPLIQEGNHQTMVLGCRGLPNASVNLRDHSFNGPLGEIQQHA